MKVTRSFEVRTKDDEGLVIEGQAIVFESPTEIRQGGRTFTEIIGRNALDGIDLEGITLLYNHDTNSIPLAKSPGTMELTRNNKGLFFKAELPNTTTGNEVYESIRRRDLEGVSFGFTVKDQEYSEDRTERYIREIGKVYEISLTPFPAYANTSVQARNKEFKDLRKETLISLNKTLFKGGI